eukprot:UC4_evm8s1370
MPSLSWKNWDQCTWDSTLHMPSMEIFYTDCSASVLLADEGTDIVICGEPDGTVRILNCLSSKVNVLAQMYHPGCPDPALASGTNECNTIPVTQLTWILPGRIFASMAGCCIAVWADVTLCHDETKHSHMCRQSGAPCNEEADWRVVAEVKKISEDGDGHINYWNCMLVARPNGRMIIYAADSLGEIFAHELFQGDISTGSEEEIVNQLSINTKSIIENRVGHLGSITVLDLHENYLACGTDRGSIVVLDVGTDPSTILHTITNNFDITSPILCLGFRIESGDVKHLVYGTGNGFMVAEPLLLLPSKEGISSGFPLGKQIRHHVSDECSEALMCSTCIVAFHDCKIFSWLLVTSCFEDKKKIASPVERTFTDEIVSVAIRPNIELVPFQRSLYFGKTRVPNICVIALKGGSIHFVNSETLIDIMQVDGHKGEPVCAFANGTVAVTSGKDCCVRVWRYVYSSHYVKYMKNTRDCLIAADRAKAKGNEYFKDGNKFTRAIQCYSEAAELNPFDPRHFGNRSAAHMKRKNFRDAVLDCTKALELSRVTLQQNIISIAYKDKLLQGVEACAYGLWDEDISELVDDLHYGDIIHEWKSKILGFMAKLTMRATLAYSALNENLSCRRVCESFLDVSKYLGIADYDDKVRAYMQGTKLHEIPISIQNKKTVKDSRPSKGNLQLAMELREKADALMSENKMREALITYDAAIKNDPKSALKDAYLNYLSRALILLDFKKWQDSIHDCQLCISINPCCFEAYCLWGDALTALEKYEDATEKLLAAYDLNAGIDILFDRLKTCLFLRLDNERQNPQDFRPALDSQKMKAVMCDPSVTDLLKNRWFFEVLTRIRQGGEDVFTVIHELSENNEQHFNILAGLSRLYHKRALFIPRDFEKNAGSDVEYEEEISWWGKRR